MDFKIKIKGRSLPKNKKTKAIQAVTDILCREFGNHITEGMSAGTVRFAESEHNRVRKYTEINLDHLYGIYLVAKLVRSNEQ